MSYCRCSGKDSELYVWCDEKYINVTTAASQRNNKRPPKHVRDADDAIQFAWAIQYGWSPITDKPHSNAWFRYRTRRGAINRMKSLQNEGWKVPKYAFDRLEQEIKEIGNKV